MLRSALFIVAGLLAALGFACAAPPAPPPPTKSATAICDIRSLAFWLPDNSSWDPTSGTVPPQGLPVQGTYADDLVDAYNLAPAPFRARLCGLDRIVLDQRQGGSWASGVGASWGLRHRNPSPGSSGRYIVLSAGLWIGRPSYSRFEQQLLGSLLPLNISFAANSNADTFDMSLLAALAHEMGHVRWYEIVVPAANGYNYDFLQLCNGSFFSSWQKLPDGGLNSKPRFRKLLTLNERWDHPIRDAHSAPPQTGTIDRLANGHVSQAKIGDELDKFYVPDTTVRDHLSRGAPWATFFAALAPDEDFVETYKLAVLMAATSPLTSLAITMPGTKGLGVNHSYTADVPSDLLAKSKSELANKLSCANSNI